MKAEKNPKFLQRESFATGAGIMLVSAIVLLGTAHTLWMLINDLFHGQLALFFDHTLVLLVARLLSYGVFTYLCGRLVA